MFVLALLIVRCWVCGSVVSLTQLSGFVSDLLNCLSYTFVQLIYCVGIKDSNQDVSFVVDSWIPVEERIGFGQRALRVELETVK